MKLDTAEAILAALDIESVATRLALGQRVLTIVDDWREKANTTAAWGQAHGLNVTALVVERDAALAKADEWAKRAADEQLRHGDLRARIEALADGWLRDKWMPFPKSAQELCALLQPAKPESALDVLSRIEDIVERSGMGENSYTEPLAKLRKLLEEQK